mmetsp:Transcript_21556/g.42819  ORF Transcript_21556/g.42819 Transcript_21556/m.42819 type:complete len:212 (+) Transcript_21556:1170-1805(+)
MQSLPIGCFLLPGRLCPTVQLRQEKHHLNFRLFSSDSEAGKRGAGPPLSPSFSAFRSLPFSLVFGADKKQLILFELIFCTQGTPEFSRLSRVIGSKTPSPFPFPSLFPLFVFPPPISPSLFTFLPLVCQSPPLKKMLQGQKAGAWQRGPRASTPGKPVSPPVPSQLRRCRQWSSREWRCASSIRHRYRLPHLHRTSRPCCSERSVSGCVCR